MVKRAERMFGPGSAATVEEKAIMERLVLKWVSLSLTKFGAVQRDSKKKIKDDVGYGRNGAAQAATVSGSSSRFHSKD